MTSLKSAQLLELPNLVVQVYIIVPQFSFLLFDS